MTNLRCETCDKIFRRQNPNMIVIWWRGYPYCSRSCMQKKGYKDNGQMEL